MDPQPTAAKEDRYFELSVQLLQCLQSRKVEEAMRIAEEIRSTCDPIPKNSPALRLLALKDSLPAVEDPEGEEAQEVSEDAGTGEESASEVDDTDASSTEVESAGEEETKRVDVRSELEHLLSNMTPLPTAVPKPSASAPPAAPEPHIDSDEEDYTEEERKIFDSIKMDISKEMMDRLAIIRKDR